MKKLTLMIGLLLPLACQAVTPLWLRDAKISPDGKTIAFTYKGDIWTVATEGGQATRLTATDDYETTPVWSPDSRSIAFAGDRAGNYDIYVVDANGGAPRRLTYNSASEVPEAFTPDGKSIVFSASIMDPAESALFPTSRMTELYKVSVADGALTQLLATPARFVSWQPDGQSFLYQDVKGFEDEWRKHHTSSVTRDIWLYDAKSGRHTNLTARGGEDTNPVTGPDGKFYFLSERNGKTVNVYEASTSNAADAKALTSFATHPVRFLSRAGNGTLAFTYDGEIYTLTPGGKPAKVAIELTDPDVNIVEKAGVRSGARHAIPSPDSKWIALEIVDRRHEPYSDIAIINVESGEMTNLTNSGYFDERPHWNHDGTAITFQSERYGMRNHASWGSQGDVMAIFLTRDAYDRFRLSEEDYALQKEIEKDNKKGKDESEKADSKDKKDSKDIVVELDGIDRRVVRLTPMSADLADHIVTADGESLYYIISGPEKQQLWKLGLRKDENKLVGNLDGAGYFASDKDGKNLFIVGRSIKKLDPKNDKTTAVTYAGTMNIDRAAERRYMFDNIEREERERFYTADMHGVDWKAMSKAYRKFLPHINNNYDFAEMVSEWLGELNVSHTGGRYSHPSSSQDDRTASLGLIYDFSHKGDGLKIAEVVAGGPFDRASSTIKGGTIVEAVNGNKVGFDPSMAQALNDIAGKKTLVSLYNPATGERWSEVVKPISAGSFNTLLYNRWVKSRADAVDRMSGGRLGYVHIQSMGDDSFRKVYADVLGKYNDREGIVIDVRWNGGGRLHEDIEVFFSGEKYLTQEIRGLKTCDMPSRRWNKPSVMIMSEACYSNAHGTPWVYKNRGIGRLVGMPVPGTMTSVNWVTMQDPTLVFGIPVIGYRLSDGSVLENQQLEPDLRVANDPSAVVKGEDSQLKAAVDDLLKTIDSKK